MVLLLKKNYYLKFTAQQQKHMFLFISKELLKWKKNSFYAFSIQRYKVYEIVTGQIDFATNCKINLTLT